MKPFSFGVKKYPHSEPLVRPTPALNSVRNSTGSKWMGGKRIKVTLGRLHSAPKPTK